MLGAIYGDMVGSRFEFQGFKSKKFEMFTNSSILKELKCNRPLLQKHYIKKLIKLN